MPNVKIYVDDTLWPACRPAVAAALGPLRDRLCADLRVDIPACQFAVMPVLAMPDLPPVNVEIAILPQPYRTRAVLTDLSLHLRAVLGAATGAQVAVRITTLDPHTYLTVK